VSQIPEVGDEAPEFTLPAWVDGAKRMVSLSDERGHAVVLAFYPGDDTTVCTRQLCSYDDGLDSLSDLGAKVWGISPQDVDSHARFAEKRSIRLPLLADVGMTVARNYGIVGPLGLRRSVFIVDATGRIAWRKVTLLGVTYPSAAEIRASIP
jgi:peroxiredoxin Q/BCP